ncbi:MAG: leucine-rich repeat domain-containing protein [Aureispira sp.]|nr:leucine-rich repeat domain-containing protein [Aureispira sp.]
MEFSREEFIEKIEALFDSRIEANQDLAFELMKSQDCIPMELFEQLHPKDWRVRACLKHGIVEPLKDLPQINWSILKIEQIPKAIGQLTKLKELDIYNTKIKELPPEIEGMTGLEGINISTTPISFLPNELCNLPKLIGSLTVFAKKGKKVKLV